MIKKTQKRGNTPTPPTTKPVVKKDPKRDASICKGGWGSHALEEPPTVWRDWAQRVERAPGRGATTGSRQTH